MKQLIPILSILFLTSCSSTIYIVRHAEKADASPDTELSEAGHARALALRDTLHMADLDGIYASQFKRTLQTVQPTATEKNVEVIRYNTTASDSLIVALAKKQNRKMLVAGHSNSVPAMLRKLGLNPSMQTIPENDFDNLFIVRISWFFGRSIRLTESTYGTVSP